MGVKLLPMKMENGHAMVKLLEKKGYKIYNPRFPKVSTEQTMSLFKQKAVEPEEVLLEELKNMIK